MTSLPTPSFTPTARFERVLALFAAAHALDPEGQSSLYHSKLDAYVRQLSSSSANPVLNQGPSEALVIAANSQHIRRWEKPRSEYPMGLTGYKTWRHKLNIHHSDVAHELMAEAGYSQAGDAELFARVRDLLLKKTLARPPLPDPLKDPEMHLFEDSICLVFLALQFVDFSEKIADADKMVNIVRKTWIKMTAEGQAVVARDLVGGLPEDLKEVVGRALAA
ncbi:hypothetical protein BCR35DRAFT_350895 [Leucosporidium creatinivorum]|uniref:Glutamyl-tRNA synthetase n=1 Tax=Leucosporidium creatinivorum TaxID=106004 RepID=A0A1Y2FXF1_9BASI|nr:hypothetical protein BCR35DRAFT_350895 [Leucosporidium creatinivorum]